MAKKGRIFRNYFHTQKNFPTKWMVTVVIGFQWTRFLYVSSPCFIESHWIYFNLSFIVVKSGFVFPCQQLRHRPQIFRITVALLHEKFCNLERFCIVFCLCRLLLLSIIVKTPAEPQCNHWVWSENDFAHHTTPPHTNSMWAIYIWGLFSSPNGPKAYFLILSSLCRDVSHRYWM